MSLDGFLLVSDQDCLAKPHQNGSREAKVLRKAAVTTVGRVEDERGGARSAPFPIPAHRTGRAHCEHPALRQSSPAGSRSGAAGRDQAFDAQRTKDDLIRQNTRATTGRLAAPPQKRANAIRDMVVNRPIGPRPGPVAEVVQPALQNAI
jgi:hypothetical protein